jgi:hypothetical protein
VVAGIPALEAEHAELKRLEKNAEDRLCEYPATEFLFGVKPRCSTSPLTNP